MAYKLVERIVQVKETWIVDAKNKTEAKKLIIARDDRTAQIEQANEVLYNLENKFPLTINKLPDDWEKDLAIAKAVREIEENLAPVLEVEPIPKKRRKTRKKSKSGLTTGQKPAKMDALKLVSELEKMD